MPRPAAKNAPPKRTPPKKPTAKRPAAKTPPKPPRPAVVRTDPKVDAWLSKLTHPLKPELESLRRLILSVSPAVREEFKWNSPSFKTTDHFATANIHGKNTLRLILHRGAKKRPDPMPSIPDPDGLLTWLGQDRAIITFEDPAALSAASAPLKALLKHWIRSL